MKRDPQKQSGFAMVIIMCFLGSLTVGGWLLHTTRSTSGLIHDLQNIRDTAHREHALDVINIHISDMLRKHLSVLHRINQVHHTAYLAYQAATFFPKLRAALLGLLRTLTTSERTYETYAIGAIALASATLCRKNGLSFCAPIIANAEHASVLRPQPLRTLAPTKRVGTDVAPGYLIIPPHHRKWGYYLAILSPKAIPTALQHQYPFAKHFFEHRLFCLHVTFPQRSSTKASLLARTQICPPSFWVQRR